MEHIAKTRQKLRNEIKDLKVEATTTGAELMYLVSLSAVKQEVEKRELELVESLSPPVVIKQEIGNGK
jgi:hypothetical protein